MLKTYLVVVKTPYTIGLLSSLVGSKKMSSVMEKRLLDMIAHLSLFIASSLAKCKSLLLTPGNERQALLSELVFFWFILERYNFSAPGDHSPPYKSTGERPVQVVNLWACLHTIAWCVTSYAHVCSIATIHPRQKGWVGAAKH